MDMLFNRLAGLARAEGSLGGWRARVLELCDPALRAHKPQHEAALDLMAAARILHEAHVLPQEALFYLASWVTEHLAELEITNLYGRHFAPRFDEIRRSHRIQEHFDFARGKEPSEYVDLAKEFDSTIGRVTVETFHRLGEGEMARLYQEDRDQFIRLRDSGHAFFFGKDISRRSPFLGDAK
jgi:hypothetical protein